MCKILIYQLVSRMVSMAQSFVMRVSHCVPQKPYGLSTIPASLARLSIAPDLPMFSLPAKSTRCNLPIFSSSSPSMVFSFMCMVTLNTEWERLKTTEKTLFQVAGKNVLITKNQNSTILPHEVKTQYLHISTRPMLFHN